MLKKALLTVASAALVCSSGLLMAESHGDVEAGKAYYAQHGCAACHGPKGESVNPAMFPKLAGDEAAFVSEQLHAFKSGERKGEGPGAIMNANAASMSDEDIANVAAFIGSLK